MTDIATPGLLLTEVTLRYSDLDPLGHVNNAVYSTLFEAGRVAFVDQVLAEALPDTLGFVLVRIEIDFRAEGRFPGTAHVETGITRVGRTSMEFEQQVMLGSKLLASARCVCVLIDLDQRRPAPWPDAVRKIMDSWVGQQAPDALASTTQM